MMKARYSFGLGALAGGLLLLLTFLFLSPDQSYSTEEFQFEFESSKIVGSLISPNGAIEGPRDCVVFVHGDGKMDREGFGFFAPFFSHFAQRGMCALSWDKPGVGASTGDWLEFDMARRAELVETAIYALRKQTAFEVRSVGVIGFSQAGWVMPKVAASENDIAYYIFVSPAVNWQRQSQFMSDLRERDMTSDEIESRNASGKPINELLKSNASYDDFLALATARDDIDVAAFSQGRWDFVRANMDADLTTDLMNLGNKPVLLLAGANDGQVDAAESRLEFEKQLEANQLTVGWFPNAGHSLIDVSEQKPMEDWDGLVLITKVAFGGKSAFSEGLWATIDEFLAVQNIGIN